jgi:hypothetical protein
MKLPLASPPSHKAKSEAAGAESSLVQLLRSAAGAAAVQLGSVVAPVLVVCIGISVSALESKGVKPVQRETCDCSCWDGRFKGRHAGTKQNYKNVFFNLEPATALLFLWTSIWVELLAAGMERIYRLLRAKNLRYMALAPSLMMFYPLFYVSSPLHVNVVCA